MRKAERSDRRSGRTGGTRVVAWLLAVVLLVSWSGVSSWPASAQLQDMHLATTEITVGGVPLTVELAIDPVDQAWGLRDREALAPGTGMLFIFAEAAPRAFWMKGMRFCLDIIWIASEVIQGAAQGVCPAPPGTPDGALPSYSSPVPVSYVLEVPAGWLAANGLGAGALVKGLPALP